MKKPRVGGNRKSRRTDIVSRLLKFHSEEVGKILKGVDKKTVYKLVSNPDTIHPPVWWDALWNGGGVDIHAKNIPPTIDLLKEVWGSMEKSKYSTPNPPSRPLYNKDYYKEIFEEQGVTEQSVNIVCDRAMRMVKSYISTRSEELRGQLRQVSNIRTHMGVSGKNYSYGCVIIEDSKA